MSKRYICVDKQTAEHVYYPLEVVLQKNSSNINELRYGQYHDNQFLKFLGEQASLEIYEHVHETQQYIKWNLRLTKSKKNYVLEKTTVTLSEDQLQKMRVGDVYQSSNDKHHQDSTQMPSQSTISAPQEGSPRARTESSPDGQEVAMINMNDIPQGTPKPIDLTGSTKASSPRSILLKMNRDPSDRRTPVGTPVVFDLKKNQSILRSISSSPTITEGHLIPGASGQPMPVTPKDTKSVFSERTPRRSQPSASFLLFCALYKEPLGHWGAAVFFLGFVAATLTAPSTAVIYAGTALMMTGTALMGYSVFSTFHKASVDSVSPSPKLAPV